MYGYFAYAPYACSVQRGQKKALCPLGLELEATRCVLGIEAYSYLLSHHLIPGNHRS